jgi:hypothetical protein
LREALISLPQRFFQKEFIPLIDIQKAYAIRSSANVEDRWLYKWGDWVKKPEQTEISEDVILDVVKQTAQIARRHAAGASFANRRSAASEPSSTKISLTPTLASTTQSPTA